MNYYQIWVVRRNESEYQPTTPKVYWEYWLQVTANYAVDGSIVSVTDKLGSSWKASKYIFENQAKIELAYVKKNHPAWEFEIVKFTTKMILNRKRKKPTRTRRLELQERRLDTHL